MKKYFLFFLLLTTVLTITESCGSTPILYLSDGENKSYAGQLSDADFIAVKQLLTSAATSKLKDTIIIKYDYNNETCWNMLDQKDKEYIMGFITTHKERVQTVVLTRQNVSVFNFREPGNNLNKIKKWNTSIIIDSTKQLFNLLFKERYTCGSSIIIMPDKRFVFLRSDAHSEILNLPQKQMEEILKRKLKLLPKG